MNGTQFSLWHYCKYVELVWQICQKISWPYLYVTVSCFFVLLIFLFILLIIPCSYRVALNICRVSLPTLLLFFLKIVLVCVLPQKLLNELIYVYRNLGGILVGIALNWELKVGRTDTFSAWIFCVINTVCLFNFQLFMFLLFLSQHFIIFIREILY